MFPDLGEGFILVALRYYDGSPEKTVDHIVHNSFPPQLAQVPRDLRRSVLVLFFSSFP